MSDDLTRYRSRRSLLVGALGGVTAFALGALSRPPSVAAVDGAPLIAVSENSAASPTGLSASQPGTTADVLHVVNSEKRVGHQRSGGPNGGVGVRAEGRLRRHRHVAFDEWRWGTRRRRHRTDARPRRPGQRNERAGVHTQ